MTTVPGRPRVHVIALGGTIAMAGSAGLGVTPVLTANELVAAVPGLDSVADVEVEQLRQVPSSALLLNDVHDTARRIGEVLAGGADGVVVTQGTDTVEETAFLLDLLLPGPAPVVVTGAMRPSGAAGADGPANLLAAVQVAASPAARGLGVLAVFDDQVHAAARVRKSRASGPGAFTSPDTGPLGWVVEGELHLLVRPATRVSLPHVEESALAAVRVAIVTVPLGDDGGLLAAVGGLGYDGVVIEAMGAGHVPPHLVAPLAALAAEIPVVLASRTGAGLVHTATYGFHGAAPGLLAAGLIPAGWHDARKARLLLTLLLAAGTPREELPSWFSPRPSAPRPRWDERDELPS